MSGAETLRVVGRDVQAVIPTERADGSLVVQLMAQRVVGESYSFAVVSLTDGRVYGPGQYAAVIAAGEALLGRVVRARPAAEPGWYVLADAGGEGR